MLRIQFRSKKSGVPLPAGTYSPRRGRIVFTGYAPTVAVTQPTAGSKILLESGDFLLLESGDKILLEA